MARAAAWTITVTSICRRCAARPMRASRSAMSCGCTRAWSEEDDGQSDVGRLRKALARRRPGSVLDLCSLPRAQPQGVVFNYSTADSCLLGALVAAATGRPLADYGAETNWGPAGMEVNAYWVLESKGGQEWGGFGVSAP